MAKYNAGDEITWTDPDDGACSGIYVVVCYLAENILLLSDGCSELEAFEDECS